MHDGTLQLSEYASEAHDSRLKQRGRASGATPRLRLRLCPPSHKPLQQAFQRQITTATYLRTAPRPPGDPTTYLRTLLKQSARYGCVAERTVALPAALCNCKDER